MTAALLLTLALATTPTRYALVIGNNSSPTPARAPLRFADDDAARFYELLSPSAAKIHLLTSFDTESQSIFHNLVALARPPTKSRFVEAIRDLHTEISRDAAAGKNPELYFFYAGHGDLTDGEGSVTLADGKLTRTEFRDLVLSGSRAAITHVIADACKSYFLVAGRGPGGVREPHAGGFATPEVTTGVGYVLSTSSDADSHEWAAFSGGIFSHEVRSALLGGADADGNGAVDYDELAAFVAVANDSIPYPRFRPRFYVQPPSDRRRAQIWAPAATPGATLIELAALEQGRVEIMDERGLKYLDVNKSPGGILRLALLAPHRYELEWQGQTFSIPSSGGVIQLSQQTPAPKMIAARSEFHAAFEKIFERPFGPDVVRGFRLSRELEAAETELQPGAASTPDDPYLSAALLGGGAAAIVAGVILSLVSTDARSDARTAPQVIRPILDDRAETYQVAAGTAFTVGGLAAGAALLFYLLEE